MQVNEIFFVGSNKYGQSGTGEKNSVKVIESPRSYDFGVFIKQVSCGYHHSALLTISGLVYTMGSNIHGTLGTSHEEINYSFLPILVEGLEGVSKIESGAFHLCALTENGEVFSWGRGMDGQLGIGTNKNSSVAQRVLLEDEVQDLSCGTNHTLLVTSRGDVFAFGNGIYGQLGTGNNKNQQRPTKIRLDTKISMVAAGQNHSLFLTPEGTMYGTGDNTSGQVGIGNGKKYVLEPQRLANPQNVSIIQAAKFSACICEGQLYVWGGATRQFVPYHIDSEMSFTELKAGNDSLMALSFKGELFSWQATIADSEVELKHFELKSKAILDFSIGQNHIIVLGDIVRTVEEKTTISHTLKCHESEPVQLRDISRAEINNNHSNSNTLRSKPPTERDKSLNRINTQSPADADKENRKPASPFCKEKGKLVERTTVFFEESKPVQNKPVVSNSMPEEAANPRKSMLNEDGNYLAEARACRKELEALRRLLIDSKSVMVDPTKNLNFFSRCRQNKLSGRSQESEKSNITLLREKDIRITQLQQELSKKQALIVTYEGSLETLQRLVESQNHRLEALESRDN